MQGAIRNDGKCWSGKEDANKNVGDDPKKWLAAPSNSYVPKADRDPARHGRNHLGRRNLGSSFNEHYSRPRKLTLYDGDILRNDHSSSSSNCLHAGKSTTAGSRLEDGRYYGSRMKENLYCGARLKDNKYYDAVGRSYAYKERPLAKSATSVVLSEKAYPFVSTAASSRRGKTRDNTPYREEKGQSEYRHKSSSRRETYVYSFRPLKGDGPDRSAVSRSRLASSSAKDLSRLRRDSPHVSVGRRSVTTVENSSRRERVSSTKNLNQVTSNAHSDMKTEHERRSTHVDKTAAAVSKLANAETKAELKPPQTEDSRLSSSTSDREVKRKEIQELIDKYAGLKKETAAQELPTVLVKYQKKYSAVLSTATANSYECTNAMAVSV